MSSKGSLFVVSAPSGAGKTTLCEKLLKTLPNIVNSISMTTRPLRSGEKNKNDYFFVSETEFKKKIKNNGLLEYAKVFGNYYGTPKRFVEQNLAKGNDVLLNIDVQGAMQIRRKFRRNSRFIFILPPSMNDLKKRLLLRKTDTKLQIKKRLDMAKKELAYLNSYDYKIVNDDLKKAFGQLLSIVVAARCETEKRKVNLK
ncbi:MAG: guanylate kinase [PVC group bacterium]|nr:guanylate kinase [PVC group bacterium]